MKSKKGFKNGKIEEESAFKHQITTRPTLISRLWLLLRPSLHSHTLVPFRHICGPPMRSQTSQAGNVICNTPPKKREDTNVI